MSIRDLPDDIEALRAIIREHEAARVADRVELDQARAGLLEQRFEIEALKARLARLLRMTFSRSSEKLQTQIEQLELTLADLDESLAAATPPDDQADEAAGIGPQARASTAGGASAPSTSSSTWHPARARPAAARCARWARTSPRSLDYVPGSFRVIRHVRPKLSCRACETIAQAPAPSLPVRRGRAGAGLLAHVLVAKYADHLPLHRQAEIYAREDVDLCRSTLADMVGQTARLVRPLVDALARHVMSGERLHADDTVVPVLEPGRGRTRQARLWTYVRDDRPFGGSDPPAVLYRYSPDRKGEHPRAHLATFQGILQADGYTGFKALYADGRITEASCWAHARRGFFEAYEKTRSPLAREALDRIGALYRIEESRRADVRLPERLAPAWLRGAAPLMGELRTWLDATLTRISRRSELAQTIRYALAHWDGLTHVLRDGRVCLDNSAAERAMRPIAIGRRNWTFAGSDAGGARAATIYSLIETAKINGADPEDYLRRMLERIADHPVSRIADLLPWRMTGLRARLDQRIAVKAELVVNLPE